MLQSLFLFVYLYIRILCIGPALVIDLKLESNIHLSLRVHVTGFHVFIIITAELGFNELGLCDTWVIK
jgi:hypothetical protein